jgi:hypothetical protein
MRVVATLAAVALGRKAASVVRAERECEAGRVSDACFAERAWCGCRGVICVAATVAVPTASAVAATVDGGRAAAADAAP